MATDLSEGCLCAFDADGVLLQRRVVGQRDQFERLELGLGTIAMAVAASSAFPGFFSPLELNGWDVGSKWRMPKENRQYPARNYQVD